MITSQMKSLIGAFCAAAILSKIILRPQEGTTKKEMSVVKLNGIYLGETKAEIKANEANNCYPADPLEELEFDEDGKVCWVAGNGFLSTPRGNVGPIYQDADKVSCGNYPTCRYKQELLNLGLPDSVRRTGNEQCWVYSKWNLQIKFSATFSKIELGKSVKTGEPILRPIKIVPSERAKAGV